MAVSLQDVERQKDALLQKHPELKDLHVVPLCDSGLSYQELSDFIEKCWRHDYEDKPRIVFSPDLLEFSIPEIKYDRVSTIARNGPDLVGLVLGIRTDFMFNETVIAAYIGTGLSSDPDFRAKGIGQLMWLNDIEHFLENHASISFAWLDIRHAWAGSSYSTYGGDPSKVHFKRIIDFYAKAIDYQKSAAVGELNAIEKLGIRSATLLFTSNIGLPGHFELEIGSHAAARDYAGFIHEFQSDNDIKRYFSKEELARRISFSQGRVNGVALAVRGRGRIQALMYGFTNPVKDEDNYFQVDGLIFHPELSYAKKRRILSSFEKTISDRYGSFSIVVSENVSTDNLLKYGYLPVEKQALCLVCENGDIDIKNQRMDKLFLELR